MYLHNIEIIQQIYSSESADLRHSDLGDRDDFRNLMETFMCKDISLVKFS